MRGCGNTFHNKRGGAAADSRPTSPTDVDSVTQTGVLRSLNTVSRTLCALCEITPKWHRVHIKNIWHDVGHLKRGPDLRSRHPIEGLLCQTRASWRTARV